MAQSAIDYAIWYLSRYPKTEQEIRIILYKKWYNSEDIQHCLDVLKKNDFINDEKFTDSFLYSEVTKKGRPLFIIKQKLIQRWIDKSLLSKRISEQQEELTEWMHKAIRKELDAYKKKWVDGFDSIQKLMRRWYQLADIKAVIKNWAENN
jgi:regulatory protein